MAQYSFSDLVTNMSGKDTLSDWDVLVAYDGDTVQNMLTASSQSTTALNDIEFNCPWTDPVTGVGYQAYFTIDLSNPSMSLTTTADSMVLDFDLTGSYYFELNKVDLPTQNVPDGVTVQITCSLGSVSGSYSSTGFQASSGSSTSASSGFSVNLDTEPSSAAAVCFDFGKGSTAHVILPQGTGTLAPYQMIEANLPDYLSSAVGLNYYLAAATNSSSTTATAVTNIPTNTANLQPSSFAFTWLPEATDGNNNITSPATLCTWIALAGGKNGGSPGENQGSLSFAPASESVTPLPTGCTACIIFSYYTMSKLFIEDALASNFSTQSDSTQFLQNASDNTKSLVANSCIAVGFQPNNSQTADVSGWKKETDWPTSVEWFAINDYSFNLNPSGTFDWGLLLDTYTGSIYYASEPQTITWERTNVEETPNGGFGPRTETPGQVSATFGFSSSLGWSASTDNPNEISLTQTAIDQDMTVLSANPEEDTSGWEYYCGSSFPPGWSQIVAVAPQTSITLSLDYFLVTNLLFPGKQVFQATTPLVSSSTATSGIATPKDTVLTGSLIASSTSTLTVKEAAARQSSTLPTVAKGSVSAFKEDILAIPGKAILGDLINATAQPSSDGSKTVFQVLQDHGYGDLTTDDFLSLLSTTTAGLLPGKPAYLGGGSSPTATKFDLRTFCGPYIVEEPASEQGRILGVLPKDGSISYSGFRGVPEQKVDPSSEKVLVSWTSPDNESQYSVSFGAILDTKSSLIVTHFNGEVTYASTSTTEAFSGSLKTLSSHPASQGRTDTPQVNGHPIAGNNKRPNAVLDKATNGAPYIASTKSSPGEIVSVEQALGTDVDEAATITGLVGFGLTGCGIIIKLATYLWKKIQGENSDRPDPVLDRANDASRIDMDAVVAAIQGHMQDMAQQNAEHALQVHAADFHQVIVEMNNKVESTIQEIIEKQFKAQASDPTKVPDVTDPMWEPLYDAVAVTIQTEIEQQVPELVRAEVANTMKPFEIAQFVTPAESRTMQATGADNAARGRVEVLVAPGTVTNPSYLNSTIEATVLEVNNKARAQNIENLQRQATEDGQNFEQTIAERGELEERLEVDKATLDDPSSTEAQKEAAQQGIDSLPGEIAARTSEAENYEQRQQDYQRSTDQQSEMQADSEAAQQKSEEEAQKAVEEAGGDL